MRVMTFLLASYLALCAASALAQQPGPAPGPAEPGPVPPPAEPRPVPPATQPHGPAIPGFPAGAPPAAQPAPAQQAMPKAAHHPGMGSAPTIRLRYGNIRLDLSCSADDDINVCAQTALDIIDHLREGDQRRRRRGDRGNDRDESDDGDEGDQ